MLQKLTFAVLALTVSSVAVAGEQSLSKDLDINQDGTISQEEAAVMPGVNEKWTELDVNADGKLDEAEFAKLEFLDTKSK